jgi:hypothetical protein
LQAATAAAAASPALGSGNSSLTAPVAAYKWEHFVAAGAEHANLIVVFRTKQLVHRFRHVCSHRERKWAGLVRQHQPRGNATPAGLAAADAEPAQGACATLLGACRHLYRHAFAGEHAVLPFSMPETTALALNDSETVLGICIQLHCASHKNSMFNSLDRAHHNVTEFAPLAMHCTAVHAWPVYRCIGS